MEEGRGTVEEPFSPLAPDSGPSTPGASDPQSADVWSPPQFGLQNIFLLMILAAVVFTVIRYAGQDAIFPTIVAGATGWLVIGCWRLFRLARRNGGHGDIGNDFADDNDC